MNKIQEMIECTCDTSYLNHVTYVTLILAELLLMLKKDPSHVGLVIILFGFHGFSMIAIGYIKENSEVEIRYPIIFMILNGILAIISVITIGMITSLFIIGIPLLGYGMITYLTKHHTIDKLVSHNTLLMRWMKGLPMMTGIIIYIVLFSIIIVCLVVSPMSHIFKIVGFIIYVAFIHPMMVSADHGMTILSIMKQ